MNIYEQQKSNIRKTWLLLFVFFVLLCAVGYASDYLLFNFGADLPPEFAYNSNVGAYVSVKQFKAEAPYATIFAVLFSLVYSFINYIYGKSIVLNSVGAREVKTPYTEKEQLLTNVVTEVSIAAQLDKAPEVYIMEDMDLNAFATGVDPSDSAVVVTTGLLDTLNREELQAVIAHEVSHIVNYDIRVMTVTTVLLGSITLLADFTKQVYSNTSRGGSRSSSGKKGGGAVLLLLLFIVVLAPIFARILAMTISRKREYLADAHAAELTRNPRGLISALEKIYLTTGPTTSIPKSVSHLCITDPEGSFIEEQTDFFSDLFATHPPMQKRILALKAMAYTA